MNVKKLCLVTDDCMQLPFKVLRSAAGYYIGTEIDGEPNSRDSAYYWDCREDAEKALKTGDWKQRKNDINEFRRNFYEDLFK